MKLYFYILGRDRKFNPETKTLGDYAFKVRVEECEVIEKPKTYRAETKFPDGIYIGYVRREDVGTKAYVCARYFLRPGKCFKYIDQRGEDATEHVYEVMALYPYCALLRDTRNGVRTCPGYNTLSLMLRGSEVNE
nr:MAG TPA: hypothetical protein [Caudoviricetes sp.]